MAKITIPVIVPPVNETNKKHWGARDRLKKSFVAHIKGAIHDQGMKINELKKPKKRKLMIYSFRKKEMDRDNLWASHKELVDAIRDLRLIWMIRRSIAICGYFSFRILSRRPKFL